MDGQELARDLGRRTDDESFERLLRSFDPDRQRAAEIYESMRAKLVRLFRYRDCLNWEDLADEAFRRLERRLGEIDIGNAPMFLLAIARNISSEFHHHRRDTIALDDLHEADFCTIPSDRSAQKQQDDERQMDCIDSCIEKLPQAEQRLPREYYLYEGREKIENRRRLAKLFGLTDVGLRVKMLNIRTRLRICVAVCLKQGPTGETNQ